MFRRGSRGAGPNRGGKSEKERSESHIYEAFSQYPPLPRPRHYHSAGRGCSAGRDHKLVAFVPVAE
jgi:hypothetical protein